MLIWGSSTKKETVNKWMAWGEWNVWRDDEGEGGRWRVIFLPEMYQWTRPFAIKALVAVFQSDKLHYNKRYEITSILIQSPICIILNGFCYYKPLHRHIVRSTRVHAHSFVHPAVLWMNKTTYMLQHSEFNGQMSGWKEDMDKKKRKKKKKRSAGGRGRHEEEEGGERKITFHS